MKDRSKNRKWVVNMDNPEINEDNNNIDKDNKDKNTKYFYTLHLKNVKDDDGSGPKTYGLAHYSHWFNDDFKSYLQTFFTNNSEIHGLVKKIKEPSTNHTGITELENKLLDPTIITNFYIHVDKYPQKDIKDKLNIDKKTLVKLITNYNDKHNKNHEISTDSFIFRIDDISKLFMDLFIKTSDRISTDNITNSVTPLILQQFIDKLETQSHTDNICNKDNKDNKGECFDKNEVLHYVKTELEKIKITDFKHYKNVIQRLKKKDIGIDIENINKEKLFKSIRNYTLKFLPDLLHNNNKLSRDKLHILEVENFISNMFDTKDDKTDIEDVNGKKVYQPTLNSIHLDYKRNKSFRDCVDDLLNLNDDELVELFENKDKKKIVELLRKISELGPHDYMRCMKRLKHEKYCGSHVVHSYMQILIMVFNYFGSNIDIDNIDKKSSVDDDDNLIKESLPYVKKIYNKILINARKINDYNNCSDKDNEIIDRYQNIYDSLFDTKSCEKSYKLFNNYKLPGIDRITKYATEHTLVFVIILIFISFIFSKFVTMLATQPVPINKNIV